MCHISCQVIQAGKFDQKSTSTERKALLEAILETEQEDTDVSYEYIMLWTLHTYYAHTHTVITTDHHIVTTLSHYRRKTKRQMMRVSIK